MRAFLLSLAALRDNHTHSDIQVVSTHPRPTPQPLCRAHSPRGAHLFPDRADPEGQDRAMMGRTQVGPGWRDTGRGGRAQMEVASWPG